MGTDFGHKGLLDEDIAPLKLNICKNAYSEQNGW